MSYNDMRRAVAAAIFEQDYGEPFEEATPVSEVHHLDLADAAIRAMDRTDAMDLLFGMVPLLDGALDLLHDAAKLEAKQEAGKPMRKVTQQRRYEAAKEMVERGYAILHIGGDA